MSKTKLYTWLLNKLSERSSKQHVSYVEHFESWCAKRLISDPQRISYTQLLDYVKYLKGKKLHPHTVNIRISSLRKYYDYLIEQGTREDNPAKNLRVKGAGYKVRKDVLTPEQIQTFYQQYSNKQDFFHPLNHISHKRNIVILGLIINQAVHTGAIARLEVKDIDLQEGSIYIPGSDNSKGRTLQLHASQIMPLSTYLSTIRPLLAPKDNELIPGSPHQLIAHMFRQIRKAYPHIHNALQIRASVIMQWIKQYNIRQVQYMCGHKQISTTEMYKQQDLEGLTNQLQKHHPFS